MVKAYLRYELADYFGGINSNRCVCYYDKQSKLIITASNEYILFMNITKGILSKSNN